MRTRDRVVVRCNALVHMILVGFLPLICHSESAFSQGPPRQDDHIPRAEVIRVTPSADLPNDWIVTVRIEVRATDRQLVVPYCPEDNSDEHALCSAWLERFDGKVWRRAKPRIHEYVLGMEGIDHWKPAIITPGNSNFFLYSFSTRYFGVRKGEPLRVTLDAWTDAKSMQYDNAAVSLLTPVFKAPSK
jgi:hypothetical protein